MRLAGRSTRLTQRAARRVVVLLGVAMLGVLGAWLGMPTRANEKWSDR